MKRVALVHSTFGSGGLEVIATELIRAFQRASCSVTLLSTLPTCSLCDHVYFKPVPLPSFDCNIRAYLHDHPFDLVFATNRCMVGQTHLRAGFGIHHEYIEHSKRSLWFPWNRKHRRLLAYEDKMFTAPSLRKIFVNSDGIKASLLERYSLPPESVVVVYNGVDWGRWTAPTIQAKTSFHFVFVGHGFYRKGLHYLLHGLSLLSFSWKLVVIGKDPHVHRYKRLAQRLGILEHIYFLGECDPLPWYRQSDAIVVPSLYDPCANVTFEGWAMGLFVVSSRYNGAISFMTPENGVVIEELKDPQSVACALTCAFHHPKTDDAIEQRRKTIAMLTLSQQMDTIVQMSCEGS